MKKQPLTIEEHYALGEELHRIYCRLQQLSIETGRRYPISVMGGAFHGTLNRLLHLRSKLDGQLFSDHPSAPDEAIHAYYPAPSGDPVTTTDAKTPRTNHQRSH